MEGINGHTHDINGGSQLMRKDRMGHSVSYRKTEPNEVELYERVEAFIRPYADSKTGLQRLLKQGLDTSELVDEIATKDDEIKALKAELEKAKLAQALGGLDDGASSIKEVVEKKVLSGVQEFKEEWKREQLEKDHAKLQKNYDKLEVKLEKRDKQIKEKDDEIKKLDKWKMALDRVPNALEVVARNYGAEGKKLVDNLNGFLEGEMPDQKQLAGGEESEAYAIGKDILDAVQGDDLKIVRNILFMIISYPEYRTETYAFLAPHIERIKAEMAQQANNSNQ